MTIKILSTHAVMEALVALVPAFERDHACTVEVSYDPASLLRQRILNDEAFDVAIVTRVVFDELAERGKLARDSRADVGRSGLGMSGRPGAPKPNIGTVDGFKRALLAAKSVVRSKDGTSGIYLDGLLQRLGIAEAMRDKITLGPSGRVAVLVAKGEVELAVQQISELLPVAGAEFIGLLPEELQLYSVFCAGVATACANRDAAAAFVASLTTPRAATLFKTAGLEPVPSMSSQ